MKSSFVWILVASCLSMSCQSVSDGAREPAEVSAPDGGCRDDTSLYRSDYFVFVSMDASAPRVVPIDLNWEPAQGGTLVEYKAWDGRAQATTWPIRYVRETREGVEPACDWTQLELGPHFAWSADEGLLRVDVEGEAVALEVPEFSASSAHERERASGVTSAYSVAKATLNGDTPGWLVHERVRLPELVKAEGSRSPFGRFHWFALGEPETGRFHLFVDNVAPEGGEGSHEAVRWTPEPDGSWRVEVTDAFELEETRTAAEARSGRPDVPEAWRITAPDWGIDATLETGSGHTGWGDEVGKGRALYRQALATGSSLHGMIELILED